MLRLLSLGLLTTLAFAAPLVHTSQSGPGSACDFGPTQYSEDSGTVFSLLAFLSYDSIRNPPALPAQDTHCQIIASAPLLFDIDDTIATLQYTVGGYIVGMGTGVSSRRVDGLTPDLCFDENCRDHVITNSVLIGRTHPLLVEVQVDLYCCSGRSYPAAEVGLAHIYDLSVFRKIAVAPGVYQTIPYAFRIDVPEPSLFWAIAAFLLFPIIRKLAS